MYAINAHSYRTESSFDSRVKVVVLHYTAAPFETSIALLTKGKVSAHYLIPAFADEAYTARAFKEMQIFQLVDETQRAWHAGISSWRHQTNLNDTSIGIEIVNLANDEQGKFTFPDYEPEQIGALTMLAGEILARYPHISPTDIVAHSDIAYTRKSDPGPRFPWQDLFERGIGAWYGDEDKVRHLSVFSETMPTQDDIIAQFKRYGYGSPGPDQYSALVRAFQMHFRPSYYDGTMDAETCAILYALCDKYRP